VVESRACKKCGVPKPLTTGFYAKRADIQRYRRICRECHNTAWRTKYHTNQDVRLKQNTQTYARAKKDRSSPAGWARVIRSQIKARTKKKGILFDLTPQDILAVYPVDGKCPILGVPFGASDRFNSGPSVDRLIPEKGYVPGNISVISNRANHIKYNATAEELHAVANWTTQKLDPQATCYEWAN
jgi:hypothetical protein